MPTGAVLGGDPCNLADRWGNRYAYLEKQLEAKDTNGQQENGSHKKEKKERREKSRDRDRDKDRKSSKREHKDGGSRERERKRHHSSHEVSRSEKERRHRTPPRWVAAVRTGPLPHTLCTCQASCG